MVWADWRTAVTTAALGLSVVKAQADGLRIDPKSDFQGPAHHYIESQLQPALQVLTEAFGREPGFPIEVYRRWDTPRVDLVSGVQRLGITASEGYWMQYSYQFAHEVGHILTNWQQSQNYRYKWFEETLAELASLYVLTVYAQDSPYDFYTGQQWAAYLASVRQQQERDRHTQFGLAADAAALSWYSRFRPQMEENPTIRSLNFGIAFELLPHFVQDPDLWKACGYLNQWDTSSNHNFRDYLKSWTLTLARNRERVDAADLVTRLLYRR